MLCLFQKIFKRYYRTNNSAARKKEEHSRGGDSMMAGIVLGLSNQKNISAAVRYGVACGTAATLIEGTQLCKRDDVEKLFYAMQNQ